MSLSVYGPGSGAGVRRGCGHRGSSLGSGATRHGVTPHAMPSYMQMSSRGCHGRTGCRSLPDAGTTRTETDEKLPILIAPLPANHWTRHTERLPSRMPTRSVMIADACTGGSRYFVESCELPALLLQPFTSAANGNQKCRWLTPQGSGVRFLRTTAGYSGVWADVGVYRRILTDVNTCHAF